MAMHDDNLWLRILAVIGVGHRNSSELRYTLDLTSAVLYSVTTISASA